MTDTENKHSLVHFLPYAGALLIILGVIRLKFYYKAFGVNILNYLETGEAITSFLGEFIRIGTIMGLSIIFVEFIQLMGVKYSVNICSNDDLLSRSIKYIALAKWYFVALLLGGILACFDLWDYTEIFRMMLNSYIYLFIAMIALFIFHGEYAYQKKPSSIILRYIGLLPAVLFLIISSTIKEVKSVKHDNANTGIVVQIDSVTLVSTPSYYYIGKTNKYIFFYNDSLGVSEIFPMERVKKITLQ